MLEADSTSSAGGMTVGLTDGILGRAQGGCIWRKSFDDDQPAVAEKKFEIHKALSLGGVEGSAVRTYWYLC
jgi:hypothetical protein